MRTTRVLLTLAVFSSPGCHLLDVPSASSVSSCPTSAVISAGIGITDFRERIPKQTAVAPPDSVLDVVLIFDGAIIQADRDDITASGGTHVATAGTANALKAEFRAEDLTTYIAGDSGRLTEAVIYILACAAF
jgi:hypothetical protein